MRKFTRKRRVTSAIDSAKRQKQSDETMNMPTTNPYCDSAKVDNSGAHQFQVVAPPAPEPAPIKRTIVTVSGPPGAGKTTLIAILAQALRSANHKVEVPTHTPNATTAIADLHEQFDVKFVEEPPSVDYLDVLDRAVELQALRSQLYDAEKETRLQLINAEQAWARVAELETALDNLKQEDDGFEKERWRDALTKSAQRGQELEAEVNELKARQASLKTPEEADDIISRAFRLIYDSARIAQDRDIAKRKVDDARSLYQKLSEETRQRDIMARAMLHEVLTGKASDQPAPRAPTMSASEKLEQANAAVFENSAFQE